MTKRFFTTASITAALLLSSASCSLAEETDYLDPQTDNTQTVDDDYEKYGKKLGVKFKGTEDIELIKEVASWLGTPYKYASNIKGKGTDCSGFVSTVFSNVYGEKLYRTSSSMVLNVNKVERDALECGDILFFANSKGNIYHVAIYLGDDIFIHSATSNNIGVKTETLTLNYYKEHYYMAGRVKSLDKRTASATPQPQKPAQPAEEQHEIASKPTTHSEFSEQMGVAFSGNENNKLLTEISEWMGTPFHYGQSAKNEGTDGIGFVVTVFNNVYGTSYERNVEKLMAALKEIKKADLQFGDIVVYKKDDKYPIIGIYLGDNKIAYTSMKGVATVDMAIGAYEIYFCGRPSTK
ncbi:MAG: C40 family peptidase [Bacteroidales bacterium]|nr:C40 family peptidase [Bacteroidales bacterium]